MLDEKTIAIEFPAGDGVTGRMLLSRAHVENHLATQAATIDRMLEKLDPPFQSKAWLWFHPKQASRLANDFATTIECADLIIERVRLITGKPISARALTEAKGGK